MQDSSELFSTSDLLTLLVIIIALSAYLATVRFFLSERLDKNQTGASNEKHDEEDTKNKMALLGILDLIVVAAGILLLGRIFVPYYLQFHFGTFNFLDTIEAFGVSLFLLANVCFIGAHLRYHWAPSFCHYWKQIRPRRPEKETALKPLEPLKEPAPPKTMVKPRNYTASSIFFGWLAGIWMASRLMRRRKG